MTAHAFSEHRAKSLEAGCTGFIPKPVKKSTLFRTISYSLPNRAPEGAPKPAEIPGPEEIPQNDQFKAVVDRELRLVINDYLKDLAKDYRALGRAFKDRDLEKIRLIGHDLKGSGAGYGLVRVSEIGAELGGLTEKKDLRGILNQLKNLKEYLDKVEIVIGEGPSLEDTTTSIIVGDYKPEKDFTVEIDQELLDVIDDYIGSVKNDCQAVKQALKENDFKKIYGIGHDLKGSGSGYGLDQITEIGRNICNLAQENKSKDILTQVRHLEDYLGRINMVTT